MTYLISANSGGSDGDHSTASSSMFECVPCVLIATIIIVLHATFDLLNLSHTIIIIIIITIIFGLLVLLFYFLFDKTALI